MRRCMLLALLAAGCVRAPLPPALGSFSDIALCAAPDVPQPLLDLIAGTLEEPVTYLSRSEPRFRVRRLAADRWRDARAEKNLLWVGRPAGGDAVSREIERLLRAAGVSPRTGPRLFRDVFARGQLLVVFVGGDASLRADVAAAAPALCELVESTARQRLRDLAATRQRGGSMTDGFEQQYGFALQVPGEFHRVPPSPQWPAAVEFARASPVRLLCVFWSEPVDSLQARSPGFLTGLQRDVLWRMHGDTLVEEDLRLGPGRLGAAACTVLDGVWQNRRDVGGGVLRTSFVHDARRGRLYGVQVQLFAPGREQHPHLRELQAWAETFHLAGGS